MDKSECSTKVKDLKQHVKRIHNRKPETIEDLYCSDCGRKCTTKNQLTLHWSYVHKIEEDLKCNICRKPLTNMAKLRQHSKKCISKHDFDINNDSFKQIKSENWENRCFLGGQNFVSLSGSQAGKTKDEETNQAKDITDNLFCNLCDLELSSMSKLKMHTVKCITRYRKVNTQGQ